jgi:hypothetical protein
MWIPIKKGMLVLILSLKLSVVPYAAGTENRGHSRTSFANISMSNCFPNFIVGGFLISWISLPTDKRDFTVTEILLKVALNTINQSSHFQELGIK